MEFKNLRLEGVVEITATKHGDSRGYFAETYVRESFSSRGLPTSWVQENESMTAHTSMVRGLHFQAPPMAQAKLVRVPKGRVLDVFVDIRSGSPTYGNWESVELSAEEMNAVFIPVGFAHGFRALEEHSIVQYKVDNPYSKESEGGIIWNDPDLGIDWGVSESMLSDKDMTLPSFKDFETPFS